MSSGHCPGAAGAFTRVPADLTIVITMWNRKSSRRSHAARVVRSQTAPPYLVCKAMAETLEARTLLSIAVNDVSESLNEGGSYTFLASNFDGGFSNPGGSIMQAVQVTSLPVHGSLSLGGSAVAVSQVVSRSSISGLLYTPAVGYSGADGLGWNATDGITYAAAVARVNLTVAPVPHLSISESSLAEGDSGASDMLFAVTRPDFVGRRFFQNTHALGGSSP